MVEGIVESLVGLFGGLATIPFGKEIIVFIISLMPILELRGGLLAASILNISLVKGLIICIIGNRLHN